MEGNKKRQWYYRGSLKSCNYSCSYCPFSKKACSRRTIQEDKVAFFRFVDQMVRRQEGGAVLVVPYGEALAHQYYWEGLAALSKSPAIDLVGAQSNFSFPVGRMLAAYQAHGGDMGKLRLWGTFHPEMVSVGQFANQCRLLEGQGAAYCVGAVGVPGRLEDIRKLRQALPGCAYLWVNKMDGLGRRYTDAEAAAFTEIDPFFGQELRRHRANLSTCADSRFVEADGTMRRCNISRQTLGNFYGGHKPGRGEAGPSNCQKKECGCYLAYCNRKDAVSPFFLPYPAFRIPTYPKAVFFDIDGTLVPKGEVRIPEGTAKGLERLAERCEIYLATSLPFEAARRKLAPVWHVVRGGVFANGARWVVQKRNGGRLDVAAPMDACWLAQAEEKGKAYGFRAHVYQKGKDIYKVTFSCRRMGKGMQTPGPKRKELEQELAIPKYCQALWEDNCLQVTKKGTGKLEGILEICKEMGYQKEDVMAFGDSENDRAMLEYFSRETLFSPSFP